MENLFNKLPMHYVLLLILLHLPLHLIDHQLILLNLFQQLLRRLLLLHDDLEGGAFVLLEHGFVRFQHFFRDLQILGDLRIHFFFESFLLVVEFLFEVVLAIFQQPLR